MSSPVVDPGFVRVARRGGSIPSVGRLRFVCALLLMGVLVALAARVPLFGPLVMLGLLIYGYVLYRSPDSWLFFLPILLSTVNLYPWTGRFFLEVPDYFIALTCGMALMRQGPSVKVRGLRPLTCWGLAAMGASLFVSTLTALWPWRIPTVNSFADYLDPYNSLRILKGFLWPMALLPLLLRVAAGPRGVGPYLLRGLAVALAIVGLVAVRERALYSSGVFAVDDSYRVIGTFASMHVGGGHIGAMLTLALPAAWVLTLRERTLPLRLAAAISFLLGLYTLLVSYARSAWLGSGVALLVASLLLMASHWLRGAVWARRGRLWLPIVIVALAVGMVMWVSEGSFLQQRVAAIPNDIGGRVEVVEAALHMMDRDLFTQLTGMGLGSFPRYYYQRHASGIRPCRRVIVDEHGNLFLRSEGGHGISPLLVGQRVALRPGETYRLQLVARSPTRTGLSFQIHEKSILFSKGGIELTELRKFTPRWRFYETSFNNEKMVAGLPFWRPSTMLFFYNFVDDSVVDIDDIALLDSHGKNLLKNGNFSQGHDFWTFESSEHTAFQAKDGYVGTYFEQGALGVVALVVLLVSVLRVVPEGLQNYPEAAAALAGAILGFLILAVTDNPFTVPRLTTLFLVALFSLALLARLPAVPCGRSA